MTDDLIRHLVDSELIRAAGPFAFDDAGNITLTRKELVLALGEAAVFFADKMLNMHIAATNERLYRIIERRPMLVQVVDK